VPPAVTNVRVLGVDPGTRRAGWGVVESDGPRARGIAAGVVVLDAGAPLEERLLVLHRALAAVIADYAPACVAVEDLFFAEHANAALKLGHARGVVLLTAAQAGLAVSAYPPAVVKRAIGGRGQADKEQVARLVGAMLQLRTLPPLDATDALAVALTHLSRARLPASAAALAAPRPRRPRRTRTT